MGSLQWVGEKRGNEGNKGSTPSRLPTAVGTAVHPFPFHEASFSEIVCKSWTEWTSQEACVDLSSARLCLEQKLCPVLVSPVLTISVYNTPTSKHRGLHVFSWKLPLASGFCLINAHSIEQYEMNVRWKGSSANNWPQLLHKHSTSFITWVVRVLDHIPKFTGWMTFQLPRVGNCLKQASFFLASLFFLFSLHSAIVFWDHLPSKLLSLSKPRSLRGLACFWGNPKQLTYESNILRCFRILQIWEKNFCVGCCSVSSHLQGSWLHKSAILSAQPSETAKTLCWLFSQKPAPTFNSLLFFSYLHQQMVPAEQHFKCYLFFLQFPTLWNHIPSYPSNISNSPRLLYRCSNFT